MADPQHHAPAHLTGFGSEEALAKAAASGNAVARRALVMWLMPTVRNLAYYAAGRAEDPEDLAQSALAEVLRHLQKYRAEGSLEGWARRVCARSMWATIRKGKARRRRERRYGDEVPHAAPLDPDREVDRASARHRLAEHLATIEPKKRMVLVLRLAEGLSTKEVAARVEAPVETVRTRLRVGKNQLAALIREDPVLGRFHKDRS